MCQGEPWEMPIRLLHVTGRSSCRRQRCTICRSKALPTTTPLFVNQRSMKRKACSDLSGLRSIPCVITFSMPKVFWQKINCVATFCMQGSKLAKKIIEVNLMLHYWMPLCSASPCVEHLHWCGRSFIVKGVLLSRDQFSIFSESSWLYASRSMRFTMVVARGYNVRLPSWRCRVRIPSKVVI